ncbi:MAG TPA: hypothetical protein VFQ61_05260, partial [Polyangiaceae bacterium]|nr:hypothetical protein [Polyangiaceae bacterium]
MKRSENHWYILEILAKSIARSYRLNRVRIGFWALGIVLCLTAIQTDAMRTLLSSADTSRALSLAVPAALLVVFLGIVQVRQRAQRQAYWSALREP